MSYYFKGVRMPVVRVGNYLLYPGGRTEKISRLSQLRYWINSKIGG